MVVDYRRLNAATIKSNAPLPRLDETLDELAGAKYFTSLDLHSGCHQLRIAIEDVPKTSFKTHMGQFQFKVLPFGAVATKYVRGKDRKEERKRT